MMPIAIANVYSFDVHDSSLPRASESAPPSSSVIAMLKTNDTDVVEFSTQKRTWPVKDLHLFFHASLYWLHSEYIVMEFPYFSSFSSSLLGLPM